MNKSREHNERIKGELKAAGATSFGMSKFASKFLPSIIHDDEHVKAIVYGRYRESSGMLSLSSGMLVATERRVIFLDHKPGYTSVDEISYEVVAGVRETSAGLFSTVTLHTRVADYTIRYANPKGIQKFIHYIESRKLETADGYAAVTDVERKQPKQISEPKALVDQKTLKFLQEHDLAVVSTVDRTGNVHGAVVYYLADSASHIYIVTKSGTQKARDMFGHQQVAVTVFDANMAQTAQLQGFCEVENNAEVQQRIFAELVKPRAYSSGVSLPPITKLHDEGFVIMRITPTTSKFSDFNK